jgi:hypothetical protein
MNDFYSNFHNPDITHFRTWIENCDKNIVEDQRLVHNTMRFLEYLTIDKKLGEMHSLALEWCKNVNELTRHGRYITLLTRSDSTDLIIPQYSTYIDGKFKGLCSAPGVLISITRKKLKRFKNGNQ